MLRHGPCRLIHNAGDAPNPCGFKAVQGVVDERFSGHLRQSFGNLLTQPLAPPGRDNSGALQWAALEVWVIKSFERSAMLRRTTSTLEGSGATFRVSPISQNVFIPSALAVRIARPKESPTTDTWSAAT